MAWIDMELVKGPELRSIIEALNGSGLVPEPIDLKKGRRIANLAGDFVKAIEAVNTMGKLDDVPEAVFNYYVAIVKEGEPPDAAEKKAKAEAKKKAAAEKKAKAKAERDEAERKKAAEAEASAAEDETAQAEAKKMEAKAKAEAKKKAAAKKPTAKKAAAEKKAPAKKTAPKKQPLVKAAVFGKLLLSKKTKKWDVKELVNALADKTGSGYVDTRRKCNTYIALLRTMGVLEDAGDKLVMAEWYRKALANR
jgi:type I site-specific restriction-modification system R (restriction) subunit